MNFRFDAHQEYQVRAVASVADLFAGMGREAVTSVGELLGTQLLFGGDRLVLDPARLLANVRAVQQANGLEPDADLKLIGETVEVGGVKQEVSFPNLTVEMETGTGKTYVYFRTALELAKRYGLKKFVVVVPSVAVREGVLKTFQQTRGHFAELFDNEPARCEVFDAKNLSRLRSFAGDDGVRFLVMTLDSFNKEENVIRQRRDQLGGGVGLHLLQSVRPVLILDEPQNMESAGSRRALAALHPLAALRYSATHRERYNRVYRLTPSGAYRAGLVKRIDVASAVEADSHNAAYVKVLDFATSKRSVKAKIAVHQRMAGGEIKEKAYQFGQGDALADKANRSDYTGFVVSHIDAGEGTVTFSNGVVARAGDALGADREAVFAAQVRYTVEQHFRRQRQLDERAAAAGTPRIKVLSLFFLDRVASYRGPDGPGLVRRLFDAAFDALKGNYPGWEGRAAAEVQGAYFATKKRAGGAVESLDSRTGDSAEDRAAYALIMREKERLLSFAEPVCFLFSHTALREGWDNPNVFQICTLNQTASETKKRQEVGRGLRLAVDERGERQRDEAVNKLTVVANESYEDYVAALQKEVEADFGADEAGKLRVANARKEPVRRRPLADFPPEFAELWERIKHRTRYLVTVDTDELVKQVVGELNLRTVAPPRVEVTKARVEATAAGVFQAVQVSGAKTVATLEGRFPLPNLLDRLAELLAQTAATPVRLTRRTLLAVVAGVADQPAVLDNPAEFAAVAAGVIRDKLEEQLVFGVRYEKDGTWYEQTLFPEELPGRSGKEAVSAKSLYDRLVYDSEVERRFAEKLEGMPGVRFYVKLPAAFKVRTPVGGYNPDWAIVMEATDEFGDGGERVYLVRETKGTKNLAELYRSEAHKLRCGARHFNGALGADYRLVVTADELPGGTKVK